MKKNDINKISRRAFNSSAVSTAFAFSIVPHKVLGADAPSNKLNLAIIGAGGRGKTSLRNTKTENLVAIADVDKVRSAVAVRDNPKAKFFTDFRVMFDKMEKEIDAVMVCTPDHTHYVASMAAIERGKHVFCEKPLAHSVYEARKMTEAARRNKVQTQMGNQGHSEEHIRRVCEWIWDGAIGDVREIHAWCNRPQGGYAFPSSLMRPKSTPAVPDTFDWDVWQGPVKHRPYHPVYAPALWRGWIDYGTGSLGDYGCHTLDPAFWALKLGNPVSVQANTSYNPGIGFWEKVLEEAEGWKTQIGENIRAMEKETCPAASRIIYEFAARGDMPPVKLTWWDGGFLPMPNKDLHNGFTDNGAIIIGETGSICHLSHGARSARIIPEEKMRAYMEKGAAKKTIRRVKGHHSDWLNACKTGVASSANFNYGGPLTEMVLLGVAAMRDSGKKLFWDGEKMEFKNKGSNANNFIKPVFHNGWKLA